MGTVVGHPADRPMHEVRRQGALGGVENAADAPAVILAASICAMAVLACWLDLQAFHASPIRPSKRIRWAALTGYLTRLQKRAFLWLAAVYLVDFG